MSADTRYKLVINSKRVALGPSRGSDRLWYYDTIDIAPFLTLGVNRIDILVVRWFPSLPVGTPFARTAMPGLTVEGQVEGIDLSTGRTDTEWEGRVEKVHFPAKNKSDIFLHVSACTRHSADLRCMRNVGDMKKFPGKGYSATS
jgi:hypothetical protein